ncbi:MAG: Gfo/Idh/MocA family oxidoreductase, partial [Phyllobacterium sp.]|nr:Gfo/Idh/MocA family oxidoreductase [Phyllobacterium sp.]
LVHFRVADLAVAALGAGKHVLCEKPVARTMADGERIVAAGRRGPGLLMIGHVSRFEPDHDAAYRAVRAGRLSTRSSGMQWHRGRSCLFSEAAR